MPRLFIKYILIVSYLFCSLSIVKGQNTDIIINIGVDAYEKGQYFNAHQLFEKAIKVDSNKLRLQYYFGINLIKLHQYNKSQYYLQNIVKKDPSGKLFPAASFYLGKLLKQKGEYKKALLEFKKAKAHFIHQKTNFYFIKSSREINSTIYALRYVELKNNEIELSPISEPVNGYSADFAAFEDKGNLYFSSVKDNSHAQIYVQEKNKEIRLIDSIIDNTNFHNANGIFFRDHQYFLFTRCDSIAHCKIMLSKKTNSNWSEPKELSNELNFNSHNITQPFLTKINGKNILFFSSDKKGGYGKLDIWYAEILDDFSIGNIKNVGQKVNSPENDITPYYHQPSNRLYFSSTWHNGFGGYDIFHSHWNDSIFELPVNAEQPINSSWNDMYYWMDEVAKHGYLTSNRDGSLFNKNPNCCPDIWEFNSKTSIAEKEDVLVDMTPSQIFKHKTGLTLPLALYFHNDEPMPNSLATLVKETYPETFEKYSELKPLYIKSFCKGTTLEARKLEREQINYFFDQYVNIGLNKLEKFKNQLIPLIKEHQSIEITIKGFASPLAKDDYNTNLSKRRISSIINYFNQVDSAALKPFIEANRLIIKSAPFGEDRSQKSTSDDVSNTKNSIYSPKAAIERRIEIQEVIFND